MVASSPDRHQSPRCAPAASLPAEDPTGGPNGAPPRAPRRRGCRSQPTCSSPCARTACRPRGPYTRGACVGTTTATSQRRQL
eukprot:257078-Prorocentrum_minimum.AAC.1